MQATVHTHLTTLKDHGYVLQDGQHYRLSLQYLTTGNRVRETFDLFVHGKSEADALAEATGEVVHLAVEEAKNVYFLHAARGGPDAIHSVTPIGATADLHATAVGKAMLAEMDEERQDTILAQDLRPFTSRTITDRELLRDELEEIREKGYAVNNQEQILGALSIAAPVKYASGDLMGAIVVSGHESSFDQDQVEHLASRVKQAANQIEIEQG